MSNSSVKTVAVANNATLAQGPSGDGPPSTLSGAPTASLVHQNDPDTFKRILVRNVSYGTVIVLAFGKETLQTQPPGGDTYELPPGQSDVLSIAPGQKLFAIALGADARLSVHISDGLPLDIEVKAES